MERSAHVMKTSVCVQAAVQSQALQTSMRIFSPISVNGSIAHVFGHIGHGRIG